MSKAARPDRLFGKRDLISQVTTQIARFTLKAPINDPMSGYFMIRREVFEALAPRLASSGFKILADIIASSATPLRVGEIGYQFREREAGISKLDMKVALDFIGLMLNKATGNLIPVRFAFLASSERSASFSI
jgi:dolichol-phosphate mannosyltransferase